MANARGEYGPTATLKVFGSGALVGGIAVGLAALALRSVIRAQHDLVEGVNAYRPRRS